MRVVTIVLIGLLVLPAGAGCTRVAIYVEHDPTARFDELRTYDWAVTGAGAPEARGLDEAEDGRVRAAVDSALAARGYERRTDGAADFLVAYLAAMDRSIRAERMDSYYGATPSGYLSRAGRSRDHPRTTAVRPTVEYESWQGSLILDISLPRPRRRIWRAYTRAVVDMDESDERREQRLTEAVQQMIERFPPS